MSDFWDNLARSTVRDLAKAAGLRVSSQNAVADLTETYGPTPDGDFVNEFWFVLRDGWLTRDASSREAIVAKMRALQRGKMSIKVTTRAGQLAYLRSLRRGPGLTEAVLDVFLKSGAETRVVERSYTEPPANAEEQRERFLTAVRDQWLAITADTIESFERAVFDTIVATIQPLTVPIDDPAGTAQRVASTIALGFIDPEILQPETIELQDYQRVIVERLADDIPDLDEVKEILAFFTASLIASFSEETESVDSLSQWAAAMFMTLLAYPPSAGSAPEGFVRAIAEAQTRFHDEGDSPTAPRDRVPTRDGLDFDELLTELMEAVPNCTAPTLLEGGVLAWQVYLGSAMITVCRDPLANAAPPMIRFESRLITGVDLTPELLTTLNTLNAREHLVKFYWNDDTVWLEQEFYADPLHEPLFHFTLLRFAGAADAFDTNFRDRFGGALAGEDRKAEFDV